VLIKATSGLIILSLLLISIFSPETALIGPVLAQTSNTTQTPPSSTATAGSNNTVALVANAGDDQIVNESQVVQLEGSAVQIPMVIR
jgi:hypothetical protein